MEKILISLIFTFLLSDISLGQQMLNNGGFEEYHQCPHTEKSGPSFVEGYLVDWIQSLRGRMKHEDCYVGDSDFWQYASTDSMKPSSGKGFTTGLSFRNRVTTLGNKRDYLMAPLKQPMIKDSTYRVSYSLHCNRNYGLIDHFGATFVRDSSDLFVVQDSNGMCLYTDEYVGYRDEYLGPDDQWHHIEGCYTAKGGEEWIALGHFIPFEDIHWHPTYKGRIVNSAATFIIDEVSVLLSSKKIESDHNFVACDDEEITLPLPENSNATIVDSLGTLIDRVVVEWPNNYTYYYQDACFGEMGEIHIETETCFDQLLLDEKVCENQEILISDYLQDSNLYAINTFDETVSEFSSTDLGDSYLTILHKKYGEVGQLKVSVLECSDCKIVCPNIIALNSDINNTFSIWTNCQFENYKLSIFDRWGNLHLTTEDPSQTWGSGLLIEQGVYTFIVQYKFLHPLDLFDSQIKSGTITVLR